MLIRRKITILALSLLLILGFSTTALAHDVPDLTRECSFLVEMNCGGKVVPGGYASLYRVGDIVQDDGNYYFKLTGKLEASNISLEEVQNPKTAEALADYVAKNNIKKVQGDRGAIDHNGILYYEGLTPGLYLVVQDVAAQGYNKVEPFLVGLPTVNDGVYEYDVNATPKVEVEDSVEPPPAAPPADEPSKLPQTGQLNWPIPAMAITGLCLIALGFALRAGKKE